MSQNNGNIMDARCEIGGRREICERGRTTFFNSVINLCKDQQVENFATFVM